RAARPAKARSVPCDAAPRPPRCAAHPRRTPASRPSATAPLSGHFRAQVATNAAPAAHLG
ncbi:hypothetical protein ABTH70_19610, partial [Acinetobacter baumannii]